MKTTLTQRARYFLMGDRTSAVYQVGEDTYELVDKATRMPIDMGSLSAMSRKYSILREAVAMGEIG